MIARYTLPEMSQIWTDEYRFQKMLEVEILAAEAMAKKGAFPMKDIEVVRRKARINVQEIFEIEKTVKHDVIAFLTQIERSVGPEARHLHLGMTSSDVLDTATSVQMKEAARVLQKNLKTLQKVVATLAQKHVKTLMAGRTHGVHAEPITFGMKVAGWHSELNRAADRLQQAEDIISFGKISGAVGTYAHLTPEIEAYVCKKLNLKPEPVSTQIVPRDRHAHYFAMLALVGASLERMALEIRHLQRTEVLEAEEPFTEGQRGSSAMPHKRNPIASENICGLARLLRSYAQAALENVALWHERDISHSSVERVILPDATIALHYMIERMRGVLSGLNVYPERMRQNLESTLLVLTSQRLMLALLKKGGSKFSRDSAYKLVQSIAQAAWTEHKDFRELALAHAELLQTLSRSEVLACFDPEHYVRYAPQILRRAGI